VWKGDVPGLGDWLLFGWLYSGNDPSNRINAFLGTGDPEMLYRTDGQFVLAISSDHGHRVEVFRDRVGLLPIAYSQGGQGIALSAWPDRAGSFAGNANQASRTALDHWLLYRKTFAPHTPFSSVQSLSSEHSLVVENGRVTQASHPMHLPQGKKFGSMAAASRELGEVLSEAVAKRVDAARRMGVLLSGGTDSSLMVALIRKSFSGNLRTVFVTFDDNPRDYGQYAEEVARKFGTEHVALKLSPRDYVQRWADTIGILQTPVPMPCHIGVSHALHYLSGKVDLMIDGDGADTVFGSSIWPQMLLLSAAGCVIPARGRDAIRRLSSALPSGGAAGKALAMALTALGTPIDRYPHVNAAMLGKDECDRVFREGAWNDAVTFRRSLVSGSFFDGFFSYLMLHGLPEDIVTSVRLGLSQGIHFTYPFLDYHVLQASLRLPNRLRYHYRIRKAPLKRFALDYYSKRFVYKPKEGFGVPLSKWFTSREFEPFLKLPLEARSLKRGLWNEREVKRVILSHIAGRGTDGSAETIPWIAANIELWARICLDGDSPAAYR
jgi:asparagine synthase (glutamine-hydrolysing)